MLLLELLLLRLVLLELLLVSEGLGVGMVGWHVMGFLVDFGWVARGHVVRA